MARAVNTFGDEEEPRREHIPGDFHRRQDGTPYVTDPSGALVKSGKRKGEVKEILYGRPSGFGKNIESTTLLERYSERMVACGIGSSEELFMEAVKVNDIRVKDPDGREWKNKGDALALRAKDAAKASLAADRGTHIHALTEEHDEDRDPMVLAAKGELLGVPLDAQQKMLEAWVEMQRRDGVHVLATEARVVNDLYRKAGSLDRMVELRKQLNFRKADGSLVVIPEGTVVVLDLKTGVEKIDEGYWQSYGVQFVVYAGGVSYDPDTGERSDWPWKVSQQHGLIAHIDQKAATDGADPVCNLIYVDLCEARKAADLCLAAEEWNKNRDVFAHREITEVIVPTSFATAEADGDRAIELRLAAEADGSGWLRAAQQHRAEQMAYRNLGSAPTPPLGALAGQATVEPEVAPTAPAPVADDYPPLGVMPTPDEGIDMSSEEYAGQRGWGPLGILFKKMVEETSLKPWFLDLAERGNFHARVKTARRFELYSGLLALVHADLGNDKTVWEIIMLSLPEEDHGGMLGSDCARMLATFSVVEAKRFNQLAREYIAGTLALTFASVPGGTEGGAPVVTRTVHPAA